MTTVTNKNGIEFDIDALATDVNGKADEDLSNANPSISFLGSILGMLQTTDETKVGYIYSVHAVASNVYAPQGGKWLILCLYQHYNSNAVLYGYSGDIHYYPGDIADGGELVLSLRSGYVNTVSMIKVA